MTGRRVVQLRPAEDLRGVSVQQAVREIRLQAGRIGTVRKGLKSLLESIDLPTEAEIQEMREGRHPLTWEAHLIGAIRRAVVGLDTCEADLRLAVEKNMLNRLEQEWKQGRRLNWKELRYIEAAVAALRTEERGRPAD